MAWAFATLSVLDCLLLDAIASRALISIDHWSMQGVANTAWAFASLQVANCPLFDAIASESISR